MKEDNEMIVEKRFERIPYMMEANSNTKYEDIPENKEIFIYGFKHFKTDKVDIYIIMGCNSNELQESDKLFNFWSNNFLDKEIQKKNLKKTQWFFMTLVKRNNFLKMRNICW